MAKKILAVVLAVAMALSAMAINVFADHQIPLVHATTSTSTGMTLEIDIPVYTQYGWGTQYDAFDLTLPTNLGGGFAELGNDAIDINWNIIVNGTKWAIQPLLKKGSTPASNGNVVTGTWGDTTLATYTQQINFGAFTHNYVNTTEWTTIPQTQTFGAINSIKLVAEFSMSGEYQAWRIGNGFSHTNQYGVDIGWADPAEFLNSIYGGVCKVQYKTFNSETQQYEPVPHSVYYLNGWKCSSTQDKSSTSSWEFVSGDADQAYTNLVDKNGYVWDASGKVFDPNYVVANPLTWDHNIENRGYLYGAEKVQLVVELDKTIAGVATYSLYGRTQAPYVQDTTGSNGDLWMFYEGYRKLVSTCHVEEPTDKLVFEVPVEYLYDTMYGAYNDEFAIFETVELYDTTVMDSRYTVGSWAGDSGSLGNISWNKYGSAPTIDVTTGSVWAYYKNSPIRYAAGGSVFPKNFYNWTDTDGDGIADEDEITTIKNNAYSLGAFATNVYLNVIETPDEPKETETVDQATEGGEGQGDDVNVGDVDGGDINVGDTEPEKNPTTGVALAVVPMLVAAAAAVVCKKH